MYECSSQIIILYYLLRFKFNTDAGPRPCGSFFDGQSDIQVPREEKAIIRKLENQTMSKKAAQELIRYQVSHLHPQ